MIDIARTALALKEQCSNIECDECPMYKNNGCLLTLSVPSYWNINKKPCPQKG